MWKINGLSGTICVGFFKNIIPLDNPNEHHIRNFFYKKQNLTNTIIQIIKKKMKIIMIKNVDIDIDKTRLCEVWPKYLTRNDTFNINKIEDISDANVNIVLDDGDVLLEVPKNSFTIKS